MRPEVTIFRAGETRRSFLALGAAGIGAGAGVALGVALGAALLGVPAPAEAGHEQPSAEVDTMPADAAYRAAQAGEIFLIDIRRPDEWQETRIGDGAIALDMRQESFVESLVALRQAYPDKPIALICATGMRSSYVASTLTGQGFPGLVDVSEGMLGSASGPGWLERGLPTYAGSITNIVARRNAVLP